MTKLKRTERGWAGHFIAASSCLFHRHTLLEYKEIKIIISTVGGMRVQGKFETIGYNRYFETMSFHSDPKDERFHDMDASRPVAFESEWAISEIDADDKANDMHEKVVSEIACRLLKGEKFDKE